ncbi:MAG: ribonuclease P protein subunit [Nitrososphaeria archaeon]|nr:ribonuclease P protein subunit [Conexivisphaerales archaeon]
MINLGDQVTVANKRINGYIVYETKNTFYIKTNESIKVVPKKGNQFISNKKIYVGDDLLGRTWERLDPK